MSSDREIALEQALVAVLGAVKDLGTDMDNLLQQSKTLIIEHSKYRNVEHPHVTQACVAIESAMKFVKSK
ncbi:TPA: hypothetical protein ACJFUB_004223 [Yersinia enterocolitica]|uniref:hypothetical protein n=1 Tax=Yersinia intermedia TaxID=631 RepID=UPI0005E7E420|nr:hypothetical protein [Yersinia intermedia]ELI8400349.1 hypothetical protein [Yersinia enterocolitica]CQJ56482.1 Uncharacterised protein [Yersinia intermedia]HDL6761583.1 hypothetical protein [Yersinia enterocolitica]HDL7918867.1 hypothetical protein [Yersinia enterocolitica]HDV5954493.1 hypothetical protein [Yersinia enterocolitica]